MRLAAPRVSPTPQHLSLLGRPLAVTSRALVVVDGHTDRAALDALTALLGAHGIRIDTTRPGRGDTGNDALTVLLGPTTRPDLHRALADTAFPEVPEGYALRATAAPAGVIAIGGVDPAGQFHGVQTLRQLFVDTTGSPSLPGVSVSDHPAMPLRGVIEGFYGPPWTQQQRLDQLDFLGRAKANSYIYAPQGDPYRRGRWREPYPTADLARFRALVARAGANHVTFTFAVSPGESLCYSSTSDRAALEAKLQGMYDLGVRSFCIPLDDIGGPEWSCAADRRSYGPPETENVAAAQVDLLNHLQRHWIDRHPGARPLQTVPTEYGDLSDTPYKRRLRAELDPRVVVMWTGTAMVPPAVTNEQADAVRTLFGRRVLLWDNYPANDFDNTAGRLLLGPYAQREAGLSSRLHGLVVNPMSQPYASRVAVFGAADFAWNDGEYDPVEAWEQALSFLAGGDARAADALLVFADLEHLAPTFDSDPWQPQAPELARRAVAFWAAMDAGQAPQAIAELRAYASRVADAPDTIRGGAVLPGLVADADPWLTAAALWGRALVQQLDALAARIAGDDAAARRLTASSRSLQTRAAAVRVEPARNAWGAGPVRVADGVLDAFLARAGDLATREPAD